MATEQVKCEACKFMPPSDRASRRVVCRECNNRGFIEVPTKGGCTHPDEKCSYEPAVNGWLCKCGASGPM